MRKPNTGIIAGVAGVLVLSALAAAQTPLRTTRHARPGRYYPDDVIGPRGSRRARAEARLSGTWAGGSSGSGAPQASRPEIDAAVDAVGQAVVRQDKRKAWESSARAARTIRMSDTAIRLVFPQT